MVEGLKGVQFCSRECRHVFVAQKKVRKSSYRQGRSEFLLTVNLAVAVKGHVSSASFP
jgi:hypothetical protein